MAVPDNDDDDEAVVFHYPDASQLPRSLPTTTPPLPTEARGTPTLGATTGSIPPAQASDEASGLKSHVHQPDTMHLKPRLPPRKKTRAPGLKLKGSESTEAAPLPPLLEVKLSMNAQSVLFAPTRAEVQGACADLVGMFQKAVIGLDCLVLDERFQPFTCPLIAGRPADYSLGDGVNLHAVFENDQTLTDLSDGIVRLVHSSYDAAEAYAHTLEPFHRMYRENEALDLAWLQATSHKPRFYKESLMKYKSMYTAGAAIVPRIFVAVFAVDTTDLRAVLLPSPQKCLATIEQVGGCVSVWVVAYIIVPVWGWV